MTSQVLMQWWVRSRQMGDITFSDGFVAAELDDKWVVTSPNSSWIPKIILGKVSIAYHSDGHFGSADPIQWPQVYLARFPHFCLMLRKPTSPLDARLVMWERLTEADFSPVLGCSLTSFGVVSSTLQERLRPHVDNVMNQVQEYCKAKNAKGQRILFTSNALRDTFQRLSLPASFRDMNRQLIMVQRFWQESLAWLTWVQDKWSHFQPQPDDAPAPYNAEFMGAYTTDPAVVQQLFRAGVPVWYLRRPEEITSLTVIRDVVDITPPMLIDTSDPTFVLYSGMIGHHTLAATCMGGHSYSDVERLPFHNPDVSRPPLQRAVPVSIPSSSLGLAPLRTDPGSTSNSNVDHEATVTSSTLSRFSSSTPLASVHPEGPSNVKRKNKGLSQKAPRAVTSSSPYPHSAPPSATKGRTRTTREGVNRNPFIDPAHPTMPSVPGVWAMAMSQSSDGITPLRKFNYLFPDPALFVTASPTRQDLFFMTWLGLRVAWVSLHEHFHEEVRPFSSQMWDSQTAFDHIFDIQGLGNASINFDSTAYYRHHEFARGDQIPLPLRREILWEIYQLGFRSELLTLDRHLCPSTHSTVSSCQGDEFVRRQQVERVCGSLPNMAASAWGDDAMVISSPSIRDRAPALEAFRQVLVRWPSCPLGLIQSDSLVNPARTEESLVTKYSQNVEKNKLEKLHSKKLIDAVKMTAQQPLQLVTQIPERQEGREGEQHQRKLGLGLSDTLPIHELPSPPPSSQRRRSPSLGSTAPSSQRRRSHSPRRSSHRNATSPPRTPRRHRSRSPTQPYTPFKTRHVDFSSPREGDLSPMSHSVMALAGKYMRIRVATMHGFPSEVEVIAWVKACFRQACEELGAPRRLERFTHDRKFFDFIYLLVRVDLYSLRDNTNSPTYPKVREKVSQVRNWVKSSADSKILMSYGIQTSWTQEAIKARVEHLLLEGNFVFEDPDNRVGNFKHPIISEVLKVFFNTPRKDGIKFPSMFNPIPLPTLALVVTGIHCSLSQWASGKLKTKHFTASDNEDNYKKAMDMLNAWKERRPRELKAFQEDLWKSLWVASGQVVPVQEGDRWFNDGDFEPEEELVNLNVNPNPGPIAGPSNSTAE
ncbi:hypothetical protein NLI96_g11862 [Meripilus lineatus]|uniref:DUF6532 domain-containing protein n=1 Tax=Meripilus lineatus TaxID=2056292 RepID=A0AAD5UR57_9APHY|nr:hypothetical protein NLI96_g11862 [Physisporinus lineatus]